MSVFRYDSRHKIITGVLVVVISILGFYMRNREKPSFDNGQAKQTGNQINGRNHGLWTWYYPSGKKKIQGFFKHGEREGIWVTYSLLGDTLIKATYKGDKLNGPYSVYSQNQVKQTMIYKDDKLTSKD